MSDDAVLACSHLRRVFGRDEFVAIEDVSLEVGARHVHALTTGASATRSSPGRPPEEPPGPGRPQAMRPVS